VVRAGTPLAARLTGGGQERERRGGTPNVAGAVGMAVALTEAAADRAALVARTEGLRRRLVDGLAAVLPDARFTSPVGPDGDRLRTAGTVHLCIPGVDREALLFLLDEAGVAASWGSSCSSGAAEPSHVLTAMGVPAALAAGALRLSLGWCSTEADVDAALRAVPEAVARLRAADGPTTRPAAQPAAARIGAPS
jgi:cysteine desulfurase